VDRFDAMTVFARVVEAGSLSAAARSIPMSLTSVSRHLAALEQRLGTQLLRRTTRHLSLTDEGRLVYDRTKTILSELQEMEMTVSANRSEPSGRLRVSAPVLIGRLLIAPRLPAFLAQHPLVDIDLLLIDRAVNLVEEDIAVAVRVGRLPDSNLVARKLAEVRMVVCAAPNYLAWRGTPAVPADLRQHDCLVFSETLGPIEWDFQSPKGRTTVKVQGRLCANNLDSLVSAAVGGAGIARVPSWQVSADMSAGRLKALLTNYQRPAAPVHALFQHSKVSSVKIRAFVDYLVAQWAGETASRGFGDRRSA
jgi:DNA-binding transcriptional LysR family regulator